jgi:hypothetical protein
MLDHAAHNKSVVVRVLVDHRSPSSEPLLDLTMDNTEVVDVRHLVSRFVFEKEASEPDFVCAFWPRDNNLTPQ